MKFLRNYEFVLLYIVIAVVIVFRVNIERTNYCTPDSFYYIEVSRNLLAGLGPVGPKVFDFNEKEKRLIPLYDKTSFGSPEHYKMEFFAVWPLGYPMAIVVTSIFTGLEPIWASKVLNLLLLALDFYLLFLIFGKSNALGVYYFCSFSMLEVCSHTWSENLVLPFYLIFIYSLKILLDSDKLDFKVLIGFGFSMVGMCLTRYASIIYFLFCFILMINLLIEKKVRSLMSIIFGALFSASVVCIYLFNNYIQTGFITGMPRLETQEFSIGQLMEKLFVGLFNSAHIIKEYRFEGTNEMLVYVIFSTIQLCLMIFISVKIKNLTHKFKSDIFFMWLVISGLIYLIFLIYITFTSTVDPFDYRTLMPFSFPMYLALLYGVETRLQRNGNENFILILKAFFIFSLIMNLPKRFILGLIF